jgi:hypothetical protein
MLDTTDGSGSGSGSGEPAGCVAEETQETPYLSCEPLCEGACAGERSCVYHPTENFGSCALACTLASQCDVSPLNPPWGSVTCQLGYCAIPCVQETCPDGWSCYDPGLIGTVPVCLAPAPPL